MNILAVKHLLLRKLFYICAMLSIKAQVLFLKRLSGVIHVLKVNGLVCAIAVFKQHVNFSFFKGKLLNDSAQLFSESDNNELAALKFTTLNDIPADDILINYLQQAHCFK